MSKIPHGHPAYFGSELACSICNPHCYENHDMVRIGWCGHPKCPVAIDGPFRVVTKGRET